MPRQARTVWVSNFKGQNDSAVPASSPVYTPSLRNVKARFGLITGRAGMAKYQSISTAAANPPVLGLFNYRRVSNTHELLRMTLTKLEKLSGGAWTDVTGTAFTHTNTTRPQYDIIDDILVMTNEGVQRPRKYIGSGNSADIASSTMPFCKSIKAYLGFLFAINASEDGTFTDLTDGYRLARYSDDWENDWSLCGGNEIVLDETPGAWIGSEVIGRHLMGIKTDGVVAVTHIGGERRFQQEKISSIGCTAPLSIRKTQETEALMLGPEGVIYKISLQGVEPVAQLQLANTLPPKTSLNRFNFARALVDSDETTYYLLYDRTGLTGQFLDSYIGYNYRSGEVFSGTLGLQVVAAESFKATDYVSEVLLLSTNTLVEEFDSGKDDDGVAITREWTTGWQDLQEEGWFHGVRVVMKKGATSRVKIAVATDFSEDFNFDQTISLAGGAKSDLIVEASWQCPPQLARWANVRVRLYHNASGSKSEIQKVGFEIMPVLPVSDSTPRKAESLTV